MDIERLCLYCMNETGGQGVCPECGKDANAPTSPNHLPLRTVLNGQYLVGRPVGQDANGVVYSAMDTQTGAKVRIREYMPRDCAQRVPGMPEIIPSPGCEQAFNEGLDKMFNTAAAPDHPEQRRIYFEENGTGYVVLRKVKKAASAAEPAQGAVQPAGGYAPGPDGELGEAGEEEEVSGFQVSRQMLILGGAVVGVIVLILVLVLTFGRSAMDQKNDPLNVPTLSPTQLWQAPTATPMASAEPSLSPSALPTLEPNATDWQNEDPAEDIGDDYIDDEEDEGPKTTPEPNVDKNKISPNSSKTQIKKLQKRLAALGWLKGDVDGIYGKDTKNAVKAFQKYINKEQGLSLDEDGLVDEDTYEWLFWQEAPAKPTPTPKPTATPAPTAQPTQKPAEPTQAPAQPTPAPTVQPTPGVTKAPSITPDSSKKDIQLLQYRLIELGWLKGEADGVYGKDTKAAVKAYQKYTNQQKEANLNEDGLVDGDTYEWLFAQDALLKPQPTVEPTDEPVELWTPEPDWTAEPTEEPVQPTEEPVQPTEEPVQPTDEPVQPTEEPVQPTEEPVQPTDEPVQPTDEPVQPTEEPVQPTDEPTEEPNEDPTIDENSDPESIKSLQTRLIELGWLSGEADGVYGESTREAVLNLQKYANSQLGMALNESGTADNDTLDLLLSENAPANPS